MTLIDFLNHYRIPFRQSGEHHHVTGQFIGVDCPWCSRGSEKYLLGIRDDRTVATCWKCGSHGLVDSLAEITGETHGRIRESLESILRGPASTLTPSKPRGRLSTPQGLQPLTGPFSAYLNGRGFPPPQMKKLWSLQGIGIAARLSWRIYIPIHYRGEVVSWTSRAIGKHAQPRYLSASPEQESVSHKSILYGGDYVRNAVIVCEGPTDVWRIGPGAVATLGTSYSRSQMLAISEVPIRAVCFDSERPAQKRALRLVDELRCFPGRTMLIRLETANDVADADEEEVEEIRRSVLEG